MPNPAATRVVLELASQVRLLGLVDLVAEQFGTMAGLDEDALSALSLAVREAAANAMKHGNAGDEGKRVRVEFATDNQRAEPTLVVSVRDQGEGFDVKAVRNPLDPERVCGTSGRGVFLMRTLMDDVQVARPADGGTEVVMCRAIRRAPPEPSSVG